MGQNSPAERVMYEIADTQGNGVLSDVLGGTLQRLAQLGRVHFKWAIFDLDWLQHEDGILHAERVTRRTRQRPAGWRLDDHGIRLFHAQCLQVIDGLFLGAEDFVVRPERATTELIMLRADVALLASDSAFWLLTCADEQVAASIVASYKSVKRTSLPNVFG